jgi:hypothetical protein
VTTSRSAHRASKTVRELGGEFWAEITRRIPENEVDWKAKGKLVDIMMGVLARYAGSAIENDEDLPVEPLADHLA